jgi:hypothetical protein
VPPSGAAGQSFLLQLFPVPWPVAVAFLVGFARPVPSAAACDPRIFLLLAAGYSQVPGDKINE